MPGYNTGFDASGQQYNVYQQNPEKEPLLQQKPLNKPWKEYDEYGQPTTKNFWSLIFGSLKHMLMHSVEFAFFCFAFMLGYHIIGDLLIFVASLIILAMVGYSFMVMKDRRTKMKEKELQAQENEGHQDYETQRRLDKMPKRRLLTVQSLTPLICATTIAAGSLCGMSIHMSELNDYWAYNQYRHYTNVDPSEPAASHADASVIVFMHGARPDGSRSMGYNRYGSSYCVAPIALEAGYSGDQPILSDIQYWAVGKDCCGATQGFACEGAQKENARTGLVKVNRTRREGSHEYIRQILSAEYEEMTYYEKAVLMTEAKFGVTSPTERLFIRFVEDISTARNDMWGNAWWLWFEYCSLFWLAAIPAGIITVAVGAGDPDDGKGLSFHLSDMKQNVLSGMNHYI